MGKYLRRVQEAIEDAMIRATTTPPRRWFWLHPHVPNTSPGEVHPKTGQNDG